MPNTSNKPELQVEGEVEVEVTDEVEEEEERKRKLIPAAGYAAVSPVFYPVSGYLNFEVAVEKSDSGMLNALLIIVKQY